MEDLYVDQVLVRYCTTTGIENTRRISINETTINLDLRDIKSIDLLPLIWCSKLRKLSLRCNQITDVNLSPLSKCKNLESLLLSNNLLEEIDFDPLSECPHLQEIDIRNNNIRSVDLSPLFHCSELTSLKMDEGTTLTADLLLRSIGTWPEVLIDKFHKILWKASPDV
ncbi:hypothetical protein EU537_00235 [Candidatus Thorarchaeota archaeon]|nr:MAG: hypothetical protein EU537_00235 [Candidatus Thorarchaeota archaeon]